MEQVVSEIERQLPESLDLPLAGYLRMRLWTQPEKFASWKNGCRPIWAVCNAVGFTHNGSLDDKSASLIRAVAAENNFWELDPPWSATVYPTVRPGQNDSVPESAPVALSALSLFNTRGFIARNGLRVPSSKHCDVISELAFWVT